MSPLKTFSRMIFAAALLAFVILPVTALADNPHVRPYGDVKTLAPFPVPPGSPEGIAVRGNKAYVSGPARFGTAGGRPQSLPPVQRRRAGRHRLR